MRSTGSLWPATVAIALCLGLFTTAAAPRALAADEEDEGGTPKKKIVRVYTTDDEEGSESASKAGYLGVQVQDLTRRLKAAMDLEGVEGALVNRVEDESPADKAGIRKGDVIVQVGRTDTPDAAGLTSTVRRLKPGDKASIVVVRDGDRRTLTVVIGSRPKGEDYEFELPDGDAFRWEGGHPPRIGRFMMEHQQDMQRELEELKDEIAKLREAIRELRQELARRPARDR